VATQTSDQQELGNRGISQAKFSAAKEVIKDMEVDGKKCFISEIYKFSSPAIISLLMTFVQNAALSRSVLRTLKLINPKRLYLEFADDVTKSISKPAALEKLEWGAMPRRDAKKFLLLRPLGKGGDGIVFLACTHMGKVCVLKLARDDDSSGEQGRRPPSSPADSKDQKTRDLSASQKMEQERDIWNKVWGVKECRVEKMQEFHVLVMPYVWPHERIQTTHTSDSEKKAVQQAVKEAIEKLAKGGYKHDDLKWDHVGFYQEASQRGPQLRSVLFDLSRVVSVDGTPRAQQEAIREMTHTLSLDV